LTFQVARAVPAWLGPRASAELAGRARLL